MNAALARLGSGYALWVEAVRLPSASYPDPSRSFFPDPVTRAIDEERRRQFLAEGAHFESEHALILMYTPPLRRTSRIAELVYDDDGVSAAPKASGDAQIAQFKRSLADLEDGLGDVLNMRRMASFTVPRKTDSPSCRMNSSTSCSSALPASCPPSPSRLAPCISTRFSAAKSFMSATRRRSAGLTLSVLAIEGFPHESFPGLLDRLDGLAIAYRFSTRFIALDAHEALAELRAYRRKWRQWMRGFWSQVFKTSGGLVNEDASLMARQTEDAITDAQSGLLSFGYYTPVIVIMGKSREEVLENARAIQRELRRDGFAARIETVNALEAWLGSLPGHVHPNVRRPLLHSLNLADLLPLSAAWPGLPENPSPLFPAGSPPLLHGATSGSTPFRLNLHVSDVGHTLIFGPTGAGKSTALAILAAQFRRYRNAKITVFDKGRSLFALAMAAGGKHYDLGLAPSGTGGDVARVSPALCPLALLEDERDAAFAEEWIASLFELQAGKAPIPRQRQEIHRAIALMREKPAQPQPHRFRDNCAGPGHPRRARALYARRRAWPAARCAKRRPSGQRVHRIRDRGPDGARREDRDPGASLSLPLF